MKKSTVETAKEHIIQIRDVCEKISEFDKKHTELGDGTGSLCDAVGFLCDYRKVLERAIDKAKMEI